MKYIGSLKEGMRISEVYLCKSRQISDEGRKRVRKSGASGQDGNRGCKDLGSGFPGIGNFDAMDYVSVDADVTMFMGSCQLNVKRIRKADEDEYIPADYLPVSKKDIGKMYAELLNLIASMKNPYLKKLAESYFVEDADFAKAFQFHSAARVFIMDLWAVFSSIRSVSQRCAIIFPMHIRRSTVIFC